VIDLHCHILPGIDDGALDLPDSLAMARVAAADGIDVIAATPHIRHDHDVRIPELAGRVEEVNRELRESGIPAEVVTGGEVAETALDGLTAEELRAVSLGAGGWILLEPRPGPLSDSLLDSVDRLHEMGFRALIAHPERHLSGNTVEWIRKLIDLGALIQATAAFLLPKGATGHARARAAWADPRSGERRPLVARRKAAAALRGDRRPRGDRDAATASRLDRPGGTGRDSSG